MSTTEPVQPKDYEDDLADYGHPDGLPSMRTAVLLVLLFALIAFTLGASVGSWGAFS